MSRMDFLGLFYNQWHDQNSLLSSLEGILNTESLVLTIIPFACEKSPVDCFKSDTKNRVFEVIDYTDDISLFKLGFYPTHSAVDHEPIVGKFFIFKHPSLTNIFMVITLEPVGFLQRALLPFIEQHKKRFYLTFLRHEYLHQLLEGYKESMNYTDLIVRRASHVNRFGFGKGETMIPTLSWLGLNLEEAFTYAQEQNAWFRSLRFEACRGNQVLGEVTVQRNGIIRTNRDFRGIYVNLILPICNLINENIKLFDKRSRRDNPQLDVRPLVVEFGSNQFRDIEENSRFIAAMRKLDNASVSVLHGNPYISMSVVDYFDGSTFDLWVLNTNELIIIPQLKSSIPAVRRLISCVFDNYAEGIIRDFHSLSK